jgi:hypothetical protein
MQICRYGLKRNHGANALVKSGDTVTSVVGLPNGVRMNIVAMRGDGSSYRYTVNLDVWELLKCLYIYTGGVADPEEVAQAMRVLKGEYDPAVYVPDLVALLTRAAIKAQVEQEEQALHDDLFSEPR